MMYVETNSTDFFQSTYCDVVDNPRTSLGRFDIPGAVIIESCTALYATTDGCGSSGIPQSKALRYRPE